MFGLNTQLSPSMSLTVRPPPIVASDLSSTYQFTTFTAEVQEPSATLPPSSVSTAFPSLPCPSFLLPPCPPCTEAAPTPVLESVFSFPTPTSLDALAEHFFDESKHRMSTAAVAYALSLLRSGDPTAEGSTGIAFDSTTLFDSTMLTAAVLPPHAELPLIMDHNDQGWRRRTASIWAVRVVRSLSHHCRSAQTMKVEGTTTSLRTLSGRIFWT